MVSAHRLRKGLWFALILAAPAQNVWAQGTVRGQVTTGDTGRPLPAAQIVIQSEQIGALSDVSGRYVITNVPAGSFTILAQHVGYRPEQQTIQVTAGADITVNFALQQQALALDELIVTGTPGGTLRRALGNDVSRLAAAQVALQAAPPNVQSLLSARSPGVKVSLTAGEVGGGNDIKIRGAGSVSLGSAPLLFVDGVRVNTSVGGTVGTRNENRPVRLNDFNPEDIESIEIIKGPAAATLYGTEASAGVIQIITKRGASGAPRFDMTIQQGMNVYMDAEDKLSWFYFLHPTTGVREEWHPIISEREGGPRGLHPDSIRPGGYPSWVQRGPIRDYQMSLTGGEGRLRYYVAGNFGYQEGYIDINTLRENGARANLDAALSEKVSLSVSTGIMQSNNRSGMHPAPYSIAAAIGGYSHPLRRQTRGWYAATPEDERNIENRSRVNRGTYSATLTVEPTSWWSNRLIVGQDRTDEVNDLMFHALPEGAAHPVFASRALGDKSREAARILYRSADLSSTARFNVRSNLVSAASLGFQYYKSEREADTVVGRNFPAPGLTALDAAAVTLAGGSWVENASVGLYMQEQLEWNNRVFLTGAIRGDDNSAFGADYDAAIYPKLSAAWVISEEPFFGVELINSLRLRGAWGRAGRQPATFAGVTLYTPVTGINNQPALVPNSLGNPDLGPEIGEEIEVGFDASLIDDRLAINFTFYNKDTKNALIQVPSPSSTGFLSSRWENLGKINNRGIELGLDARVVELSSLRWDMGFSLTTNRNRVLDMGGVKTSSGSTRNVVGYPLGSRWFPTVVSAEWLGPAKGGRAVKAMCKNAEGGVQECAERGPADIIYQGRSPEPKWWGGWNSTLTLFDNLRLFGNVEFMGGHLRSSCPLGCSHPVMQSTAEINGDPRNGVNPDPIVWWYSRHTNAAFSGSNAPALQTHPAGWVRVRDLSATYDLPDRFSTRFRATQSSISLSARNLWFLWQETPVHFGRVVGDPEASGTGFHLPTSIMATLRLTF